MPCTALSHVQVQFGTREKSGDIHFADFFLRIKTGKTYISVSFPSKQWNECCACLKELGSSKIDCNKSSSSTTLLISYIKRFFSHLQMLFLWHRIEPRGLITEKVLCLFFWGSSSCPPSLLLQRVKLRKKKFDHFSFPSVGNFLFSGLTYFTRVAFLPRIPKDCRDIGKVGQITNLSSIRFYSIESWIKEFSS